MMGLVIGSFLNVCIYRIPHHQDIVFDRSHCSQCGQTIRWFDLIPVISYLILGGKCRFCQTKLSIQYPIIELLNAVAYVGIVGMKGLSYEAALLCLLFSTLLVISLIDYRYQRIPNGINLFLLVVAVLYVGLISKDYVSALLGAVIVSLPLLIVALVTKGIGLGDVKLMAVCGLLLGWQNILLALFIGSLTASIVGLSLIAAKKIKRKDRIPLGPFLSLGIMVAGLWGESLIGMYLDLLFS